MIVMHATLSDAMQPHQSVSCDTYRQHTQAACQESTYLKVTLTPVIWCHHRPQSGFGKPLQQPVNLVRCHTIEFAS